VGQKWERYGGFLQPIGSMYGIYANIGGILMVNVTIYSIHGMGVPQNGWFIIIVENTVKMDDLGVVPV
jgi:hypothetical protein